MQPVLDDEQIRALLASPRYLAEREASAERSQVYHSETEGLMSSSIQSLNFISTGQLVAPFSHQSRLNQDIFSKKEEFSLRHQQVFGSNELFLRLHDVFRRHWTGWMFWEVMNRFSEIFTQQILRDLFSKEIETTCLLKRDPS